MISEAISVNSYKMLNSKDEGISALKELQAYIDKLRNIIKTSSRAEVNALAKMQIDYFRLLIGEYEMTRSLYRGVYCNFLKEAKEKYGVENLHELPIVANDVKESWIKTYMDLKKEIELDEKIEVLYKNISRLINKEQSLFEGLSKI